MLYSALRVIKFSLQDIGRNISLSFMTVLILVLMLLSVNTLLVIRLVTGEATALVKDQIDVSIYFSHDATEENIKEVIDYVGQFPEVVETVFFNKDKVAEQFRELHKDNAEIIASLEELGENPFGPTLVVRTREPRDYQKIITSLQIPEYENIIEAKTFSDTEKTIARIDTITTQVEKFSLFLSVLFAVIAFFVIFNTIRVAIYTQRTEISIKKLVGATNWFVRGPYLLEAFFFSVASVLITSLFAYFAIRFSEPYITVVFQKEGILTNYFNSHIIELVGIQFAAVFLLTVFSSLLAMRRHLRV